MKIKILVSILIVVILASCDAPEECDFTGYQPVKFECEWAQSNELTFDSPPPAPTSTPIPTSTPTLVPVYNATSIFGEYNIYGEIEARGTEVAQPSAQFCPWFDAEPEPGCENHNPNAPSKQEINDWVKWYWENHQWQSP